VRLTWKRWQRQHRLGPMGTDREPYTPDRDARHALGKNPTNDEMSVLASRTPALSAHQGNTPSGAVLAKPEQGPPRV